MTEAMRPRILHVSADFPDTICGENTQVIKRFVDLTTAAFDHTVFSLNRRSPAASNVLALAMRGAIVTREEPFPYGSAIEYSAPSSGVFHATMLERLGEWIAQQIDPVHPPQLLVAHKLTIEGIAVAHAAKLLGLPFAIMIQGNTDGKILRVRRDLRKRLRDIYRDAAQVMSLAPWSAQLAERLLGPRSFPPKVIPAQVDAAFSIQSPVFGRTQFLSAFNLRDYSIKNLAGLARVAEFASEAGEPLQLSIAGGGSPRDWRIAQALTKSAPGIGLLGSKAPQELAKLMNQSVAFVMPSRRESFGLVFIEALRSGCPIIYPKGAAVDGYFDDRSFAIAVDARNPRSVAEAMRHASVNQTEIKRELRDWQEHGGLDRFSNTQIAADFSDALQSALAQ